MSTHLAAAIAATATPSPVISPTVAPTATPVVHALAAHAATAVSSPNGALVLLNALASQISQNDIIAIAAVVAVALQALLNKVSWLQHDIAWVQNVRRQFVAVSLPLIGTLLASLASGQNDLHLAPVVYLVGQILFYVVKTLQGAVSTSSATTAQTVPAATVADPTNGVG